MMFIRSCGRWLSIANRLRNQDFTVTHERQLDDGGGQLLAADFHVYAVAYSYAVGYACQRNRFLHGGAEGAAGDFARLRVAGDDDFLMGAQHAAFFAQDQAHELRVLAFGQQGGLADEVALADQVDGPRQARVERVDAFVHVLVVQVHARFQAQGVARTQAGRLDARGDQSVPQRFHLGRRDADFKAVFARVAGARQHDFAEGGVLDDDDVERLDGFGRGLRFRQHLPYLGACVRALHGHQGHGVIAVAALGNRQAAVGVGILLLHPGHVFFRRARVDDQAEPVFIEEVDDQVIDDGTFGIQHARVQCLARYLQLVDIIGQQAAQEGAHVRAFDIDHAHMRHVEHAGIAAHGVVFFDLRAVVDGHVPAAEIDHAGAEGTVGVVEWGRFERHGFLGTKVKGEVNRTQNIESQNGTPS